MKQRLLQILLPVAFSLIRQAWGASALVWAESITIVRVMDEATFTAEHKLTLATSHLISCSGLPHMVCRRLIQMAHVYVRLENAVAPVATDADAKAV